MKKLNLGCGHDIKPGWVNLDSKMLPGVDVAHDIESLPLPFDDEAFDEILAKDVLEHVEYIGILKDIHRILKTGGLVTVHVPHFTSVNNHIDPTHKKMFSIQTFEFFVKNSTRGRSYYFDFSFKDITSKKIDFVKSGIYFYNHIIEKIVNYNDKTLRFYESTGFCRLFPAQNINITLIK